ncbi:MAG: helix-hairpin-helix domain-containing protein [Persephonella sp.]|nr:helix-hairpin-helix domain-containing protein [Persephonella sp.]
MNKELLKLQVALFTAVVLFSVSFFTGFILLYSEGSSKSLKINVNSGDILQLKKVPYIGEKTAKKIIRIREEKNGIKNLNQLKDVKYYRRFKYFLKVE